MVIRKLIALPLFAGALVAGSIGAFAQSATPAPAPAAATDASPAPMMGGHHHKNRMMSALTALDLSDDQKAKIKGYMTSYRAARKSATPETREQLRGQIEGVLTPDQRTQFETQMKTKAQAGTAPTS